jgi:hypothetical protein
MSLEQLETKIIVKNQPEKNTMMRLPIQIGFTQ